MATYYLVGSSGNWNGGAIWASSSGGSAAVQTPTSSDSVVFDVHSTGSVTCNGACNCLNMTMTSPGAGTIVLSGGTNSINIYGSMTLASGMTFLPVTGATINFLSTTTGQTITNGGYTLCSLTFNGVGGAWAFQDNYNPIAGQSITLTNGSVNLQGHNVGATNGCTFSSVNSNTRSLTMGAATWTWPNSSVTVWDVSTTGAGNTSSGLTLSAASSTFATLATNTSFNFYGCGLTYGAISMSTGITSGSESFYGDNTWSGAVNFQPNTGAQNFYGNNTFSSTVTMVITTGSVSFGANTTFNGTTSLSASSGTYYLNTVSATSITLAAVGTAKLLTSGYSLGGNITCSGSFTTTGNSAILRNFIYSTVTGTARTISAASLGTCTSTDFRDITGAGAAAPFALGTITGGAGDCGGNSGMTLPGARNCYFKVASSTASANWNASNWYTTSGGSTLIAGQAYTNAPAVPLPQDVAIIDSGSTSGSTAFALTINEVQLPTINMLNVNATPAFTFAMSSHDLNVYGAFKMGANLSSLTGTANPYLRGRGSQTLTMSGITFPAGNIIFVDAAAGTYTLGSALSTTSALSLQSGTLALGGFNVSCGSFSAAGTPAMSGTGNISCTTASIGVFSNLSWTGSLTCSSTFACSGGTCSPTAGISCTTGTLSASFTQYPPTVTCSTLSCSSTLAVSAGTLTTTGTIGCTSATVSGTGAVTPGGTWTNSSSLSLTGGQITTNSQQINCTSFAMNQTTAASATVTITIASPGLVTYTSHPFATGNPIWLTTSGALPTGLLVDQQNIYYVIYNDANSFWLATSYANAQSNTKINTSGTQSGTHTLTGSTILNLSSQIAASTGTINISGGVLNDSGSSGELKTSSASDILISYTYGTLRKLTSGANITISSGVVSQVTVITFPAGTSGTWGTGVSAATGFTTGYGYTLVTYGGFTTFTPGAYSVSSQTKMFRKNIGLTGNITG